MERVLTRTVGRYQAGEIRDWPLQTWKQIAANFGKKIEYFSKPVAEVVEKAVKKEGGK